MGKAVGIDLGTTNCCVALGQATCRTAMHRVPRPIAAAAGRFQKSTVVQRIFARWWRSGYIY